MKTSQLTFQRLHELLNYDKDTGIFVWKVDRMSGRNKNLFSSRVGDVAGWFSGGYIHISIDGISHRAHRLAWLYSFGNFPSKSIDHIDGDRANNKLSNLREASLRLNAQNRAGPNKNTSSGLIGAHRKDGKWMSQIRSGGRNYYLGVFDTPEEANAAYLGAKEVFHTATE